MNQISNFYEKIKNNSFLIWFKNSFKKSILILLYSLFLSLLSASIFYYFISFLPRQRDQDKIKPQIEFLADKILWDGSFIVTEMTHRNISQNKYYDETLTMSELEHALKGNYFDTNLYQACFNKNGEQYKIGGFVSEYLSNINSNIGILLRYIIFLDPELLNIINELQRNILFESWDTSFSFKGINFDGKTYKPVRTDLSRYKIALFEFYNTLQKLDKYVDKNCYSKLKSLRAKADRAFFFRKKYKLAIIYNQKILKIIKNDKVAMFYLGASLINDYQFDQGIEILKNFLKLYPDQEQFIKSNIRSEYAKRKIFENLK
jgi:hypothetical protein